MLQGIEAKISLPRCVRMAVDRDDSAFLAELVVRDDSGQ
jgi:hypothetical protein